MPSNPWTEEDQAPPAEPIEAEYHQSEDMELLDLCAERLAMVQKVKLYESHVKEFKKDLEDLDGRIQGRMDGHRSVMCHGFSLRWVHKTRKGYTVAATEWDQFEFRSPF